MGSNTGFITKLMPGPPCPKIECLEDGKKIATVIIDCTQLPILSSSFDPSTNTIAEWPEWQNIQQELYTNGCDYFSFIAQEFDLSNIANGQGLDSLVACMCYARPQYGAVQNEVDPPPTFFPTMSDFASNTAVAISPALLTNTGTRQTVPLMTQAASNYIASHGYTSFQSFPFLGGKSTRVRFFKPIQVYEMAIGLTYGKFQLQFTNFEIESCNFPTLF